MSIASQLETIRQAISEAEKKSKLTPGSVTLLAVSKTFPATDVAEAYAAGQRHFGENRLQEAQEKKPQLPPDCEWHLIGPLQRNKVRKALSLGVAMIQAVDSLKLAQAISRIAGELGVCARILLEVNVDAESSKHGFGVQQLRETWQDLAQLEHLEICGLMCIPEWQEEPEQVRPAFKQLRELRDELRQRGPWQLPELSMGMSHDFGVAIEEGATIVRVGTAIFGGR